MMESLEKEGSSEIAEIVKKLEKKYFPGPRPETDFSKLGDVKLIDGKIFLVYHYSQQTRASGYTGNRLIVLDSKDLSELFEYKGGIYNEFTNYTDNSPDVDTSKRNYNKPEIEFKEIGDIKSNTLEILNGNDEIIEIKLPEELFTKKD